MRIKLRCIMLMGVTTFLAALAAGCSVPVLKQDIPVSTNPMGAKIYANGNLIGVTPAKVSLERTQNHILTLVKDNYRQVDVTITKRYQNEKVYLKAIQSGISSGLFFKSGSMGLNSSMSSLSYQEDSGEAYILYPPTVTVNLSPLTSSPAVYPTGTSSELQNSYESSASGTPPIDNTGVARELLKTGAAVSASQIRPVEKKFTTS